MLLTDDEPSENQLLRVPLTIRALELMPCPWLEYSPWLPSPHRLLMAVTVRITCSGMSCMISVHSLNILAAVLSLPCFAILSSRMSTCFGRSSVLGFEASCWFLFQAEVLRRSVGETLFIHWLFLRRKLLV